MVNDPEKIENRDNLREEKREQRKKQKETQGEIRQETWRKKREAEADGRLVRKGGREKTDRKERQKTGV